MNPLPRILALVLFVVLAVLTATLALPFRQSRISTPATGVAPSVQSTPTTGGVATNQVTVLSHRVGFTLAVVAVVLAAALVFSVAARTGRDFEPLAAARHEIGALTKLAQTSAAQDAELTRERDVRRRAEEDARLRQELLAESVDEKIRLGRDLHDGIIQSLYAVGLTLETMRPLLQKDAAAAERKLEDVRSSLNAAIRDVRAYITGLAPENLKRATFSRAVVNLFEQLRAGRNATFDVKVDDDAAAQLTPDQHIEAIQIAREAISNALRHGGATQIMLRLHQGDRAVGLLVQDNGAGFDPASNGPGGHGLGNMRARAQRAGADLRVHAQRGEGVRVIVTFPVREPV